RQGKLLQISVQVLSSVRGRGIAEEAPRPERTRPEAGWSLKPPNHHAARHHFRGADEEAPPVRLVDIVEPAVLERRLDLILAKQRAQGQSPQITRWRPHP